MPSPRRLRRRAETCVRRRSAASADAPGDRATVPSLANRPRRTEESTRTKSRSEGRGAIGRRLSSRHRPTTRRQGRRFPRWSTRSRCDSRATAVRSAMHGRSVTIRSGRSRRRDRSGTRRKRPRRPVRAIVVLPFERLNEPVVRRRGPRQGQRFLTDPTSPKRSAGISPVNDEAPGARRRAPALCASGREAAVVVARPRVGDDAGPHRRNGS